jgi:hypothetical protein
MFKEILQKKEQIYIKQEECWRRKLKALGFTTARYSYCSSHSTSLVAGDLDTSLSVTSRMENSSHQSAEWK